MDNAINQSSGCQDRTFTCFAKLPFELRSKIWKLSVPERLITVRPAFIVSRDTCVTAVESGPVELLEVCRESQAAVKNQYSKIRFNGDTGGVTYFNCRNDTLFLDLPDNSLDVDQIMKQLGSAFEMVETLAVKMKSHMVWGFPGFLRATSSIRKLIFVDDPENSLYKRWDVEIYFYLMDLGLAGLVRGSFMKTSGSFLVQDNELVIKLEERERSCHFETKLWIMSHDLIKLVVHLDHSKQNYILLL